MRIAVLPHSIPRNGRNLTAKRWLKSWWLCCLFACGAALNVQAQTLTVRNFLNPDAPIVRESLTEIIGENFTDETDQNPFDVPTLLGGVSVTLDGVPQRLRAVAPDRVIFIVDARGTSPRTLVLETKTGATLTTTINIVSTWPSVLVQSTAELDENAFLPSGLWTTTGISQVTITNEPIPVGSAQTPTRVTITGSGWRYATYVRVWLNTLECRVSLAGAASFFPGLDELVFEIPPSLAGKGPFQLRVLVGNRESNYARINLGAAQ